MKVELIYLISKRYHCFNQDSVQSADAHNDRCDIYIIDSYYISSKRTLIKRANYTSNRSK